jgi:hypothetical protein
MKVFFVISNFILAVFLASAAQAADFVLRESLGHTWTNESVAFELDPSQTRFAEQQRLLLGPDEQHVPYQVTLTSDTDTSQIHFQTDLLPYETRTFQFSQQISPHKSELVIKETDADIRIENEFIGLALRKTLKSGEGPIAALRLRSGEWVGGSSLNRTLRTPVIETRILAQGPVFVEVQCDVRFSGGGSWRLRFRINRGEPVIVIEEQFDVPGDGRFNVILSDEHFAPSHLLFRHGMGGNLGKVDTEELGSGAVFKLEPWLRWWEEDRQGNWLAVYQPSGNSDLLMLGLLRPSVWKDPDWSGQSDHVDLIVPVRLSGQSLIAHFPLGGGRRVWMLGTPQKEASLTVLADNKRKQSPLPQDYLIKYGDFPLDTVKDTILRWQDDGLDHPRLFIGEKELNSAQQTMLSDPKQLKRWESQQAIDKYNIEGPLKEFYATRSEKLGAKMVNTSLDWLDQLVLDDLLEQNSRVSLGVAPHNQAVLLLPAINLVDSALAVESLSSENQQKILAKLAFLAYVVNSDDYWSPQRGFEANPNMTTTVAHYQVVLASLLPSHPKAGQWAKKGLDTLSMQLEEWSDSEGGWLEAPHYALVAYDHMLAAFLAARRAGFSDFVFDERMKKIIEWLAKISSPPDQHTHW